MAALAQRTPVAPVPEQFLITTMRDDVVNDRGLSVLAALHALLAERVRLQKDFAGLKTVDMIPPIWYYFLALRERTRGCSSMVEHQPSKLDTWVRFPSPAFE